MKLSLSQRNVQEVQWLWSGSNPMNVTLFLSSSWRFQNRNHAWIIHIVYAVSHKNMILVIFFCVFQVGGSNSDKTEVARQTSRDISHSMKDVDYLYAITFSSAVLDISHVTFAEPLLLNYPIKLADSMYTKLHKDLFFISLLKLTRRLSTLPNSNEVAFYLACAGVNNI